MKTQVLLAVTVGSLMATVVGAVVWSARTQSAQIESLAEEVRREHASLVRLEARLAERRSVQPAAVTFAPCPPGSDVAAGGLEAAVQNAVNRTLTERETSERLEREAKAQPSAAAANQQYVVGRSRALGHLRLLNVNLPACLATGRGRLP